MKNKYIKAALYIAALGFVALLFFGTAKARIIRGFEYRIDEYQASAQAALAGEAAKAPFGVRDIFANGAQVDFTASFSGFATQTIYRGICYSADDTARTYQGIEQTFTKYGGGLLWEEAGGDNRCYVEKLRSNWYYFDMRF